MKKRKSATLAGKKVAILYHAFSSQEKNTYYSPEHHTVDDEVKETVEYVNNVFKASKIKTKIIKVSPGRLEEMKNLKVDYIFNLVDSKAMEMQIIKILDRMQIKYSGSRLPGIINNNNKIKCKSIFVKHGLPTPEFSVIKPSDKISRQIIPGKFPLIVKPAFEHCSLGITVQSVATNFTQLKKIVKRLRHQFAQTLICEEFIRGEELQVTILEKQGQTVALPISEMRFVQKSRNKWNIYGFAEKWDRGSKVYKSTAFVAPPKNVPPDIGKQIRKDAIRAFYVMGFRDYARFDIRYHSEKKQWYFLEGNANPSIGFEPGDSMGEAIKAAGLTIPDFYLQILRNSL